MNVRSCLSTVWKRHGAMLRFIPVVIWISLILWLSLTPVPAVTPAGVFGWDKFLHAAAYCTLTMLVWWATTGRFSSTQDGIVRITFAAAAFGGLVEIAQGVLTTSRTPELEDFLANGIGAAAAAIALRIKNRRLKQTASNSHAETDLQTEAGRGTPYTIKSNGRRHADSSTV